MTKHNNHSSATDFQYFVEQFADIKILRYNNSDFEQLSLNQKSLVYALSNATLWGRDIIFDQNSRYNLWLRRILENIYQHQKQNNSINSDFLVFIKRFWFSNGIHHHYSTEKIKPNFSADDWNRWISQITDSQIPEFDNLSITERKSLVFRLLFDETFESKRVVTDNNVDVILNSANNLYHQVSQSEAEEFYKNISIADDKTPISYGLNSQLVKNENIVSEKVWKLNGMYHLAIEKIIFWLNEAIPFAENEIQKETIQTLIQFYTTGDLIAFDNYNIKWLSDHYSNIDFINGFIETYGDPLGLKATWEGVVQIKDYEGSERTDKISKNALWFEQNAPIAEEFKKEKVEGIQARVISVAMLGGDCYPTSPLGINLPNSQWIREIYGSKSVTLSNIAFAHHQAGAQSGFIEEFAFSSEEIELHKRYGAIADMVHTDLHECIGHGSGKLKAGVSADALKMYGAPIEEARADLFGLYYMMDEKLVELGIIPHTDVATAQYNSYIRNGLFTQLTRIELGKNIEQAHMRNRQAICKWIFEKGKADRVIEQKTVNSKTFFVVKNHQQLRKLFGELLFEIQRIKSEGDFESAQNFIENYGVKIDQKIHQEVIERYQKLNLAPYSGFINPKITPIFEEDKVKDYRITFVETFEEQMIRYSSENGILPFNN